MKRLLAVFCLAVIAAVPAFGREGFGFSKKAVDMVRTIPPKTNAGARRVKLSVRADRRDAEDDARTLERYVSDAILAGQGTVAEGGRPEVEINVSLDRLDSAETWNTETEYVRQQTGTKQKWNDKKQKMETEPVYSNVPVQKQYKVLSANLDGSFDISAKNADVASGSIDRVFKQKYGDGDSSPAPSEVEDNLLRAAANEIAAEIVATQDRVRVLLPRASFESLIPLAESGDWERYLAAVEAVPPRKSAKDEAYRQYALGVAKEALGYARQDRNEALDLLRAASSHYEIAIATNTSEELFRKGYTSLLASGDIGTPATRLGESVKKFEAWTSAGGGSSAVRVASVGKPSAGPVSSSQASTSSPAKQGMRNQTVIDLAKAGLSDENIIMAIDAAEATQFDVAPNALIELAKGGVSKGVIAHMQKKARR